MTEMRLRGAFTIDEVFAYEDAPTVFGQFTEDSCVAACCKMLLNRTEIPEAELRVLVKVVAKEGTHIKNALYGLTYYEPSVIYSYQDKLSIDELKAATEKGLAMITIQTPVIGLGYHPVIVDGFKDNDVLIRDPLPQLQGSAYKITLETFIKTWTGQAVILDQ